MKHGSSNILDIKKIKRNNQINLDTARLIDSDGTQLGIYSSEEAYSIAQSKGLDLVLISEKATPPILKIVDWDKYRYELEKDQKAKKKSKTIELKQLRMGLKIGQNDLEIKANKVKKFIQDGHKVKVGLRFKGREMAHPELGDQLLNKFFEMFNDSAIIDQRATLNGREMTVVYSKKR